MNVRSILKQLPSFDLKTAQCVVMSDGSLKVTLRIPRIDGPSRLLQPVFAHLPEVLLWARNAARSIEAVEAPSQDLINEVAPRLDAAIGRLRGLVPLVECPNALLAEIDTLAQLSTTLNLASADTGSPTMVSAEDRALHDIWGVEGCEERVTDWEGALESAHFEMEDGATEVFLAEYRPTTPDDVDVHRLADDTWEMLSERLMEDPRLSHDLGWPELAEPELTSASGAKLMAAIKAVVGEHLDLTDACVQPTGRLRRVFRDPSGELQWEDM